MCILFLPSTENCHVQETHIKVDFKPKRVNFSRLNAGNYVELLNLFHLDGAEFAFPEQRLSGVDAMQKNGTIDLISWTHTQLTS